MCFCCSEGYSSEKVTKSADFIKSKISTEPKIGIICGSGLSGIGDLVTDKTIIVYKDIPSFVESTGKPKFYNKILMKSCA